MLYSFFPHFRLKVIMTKTTFVLTIPGLLSSFISFATDLPKLPSGMLPGFNKNTFNITEPDSYMLNRIT